MCQSSRWTDQTPEWWARPRKTKQPEKEFFLFCFSHQCFVIAVVDIKVVSILVFLGSFLLLLFYIFMVCWCLVTCCCVFIDLWGRLCYHWDLEPDDFFVPKDQTVHISLGNFEPRSGWKANEIRVSFQIVLSFTIFWSKILQEIKISNQTIEFWKYPYNPANDSLCFSNSISIVVTVDVHVKEAGGVVVSVNVTNLQWWAEQRKWLFRADSSRHI